MWPLWLGEFLPGAPADRFQHLRGTLDRPETQQAWVAANPDVKPRAFCRRCNNEWMKDLEDEARPVLVPLIRGEERTLSPDDRVLVARWAIKTAMTADYSYGPEDRVIPERHYPGVYKRRVPAGGTQILLACLPGGKGVWHRKHGLGPAPSRTGRILWGYCSTFAIGDLVIQVLWAGDDEDRPTTMRTSLGRATVRCWPEGHFSVVWPPALVLDGEETLAVLCESPSIGFETR